MRLDKVTLVAALITTLSAAAQAPDVTPASVTALAPETTPKRAGTVRIGVALPEAARFQATVRMDLIEFLSAPGVDVLPIRSTRGQAVESEARSADCDFILYTSLHGMATGSNFAYRLYVAGGGIPVVAGSYQVPVTTAASGGTEAVRLQVPTTIVKKVAGEVLGAVTSRGHFHEEDATLGNFAVRWPQPFGFAGRRN